MKQAPGHILAKMYSWILFFQQFCFTRIMLYECWHREKTMIKFMRFSSGIINHALCPGNNQAIVNEPQLQRQRIIMSPQWPITNYIVYRRHYHMLWLASLVTEKKILPEVCVMSVSSGFFLSWHVTFVVFAAFLVPTLDFVSSPPRPTCTGSCIRFPARCLSAIPYKDANIMMNPYCSLLPRFSSPQDWSTRMEPDI